MADGKTVDNQDQRRQARKSEDGTRVARLAPLAYLYWQYRLQSVLL